MPIAFLIGLQQGKGWGNGSFYLINDYGYVQEVEMNSLF